MKPDEREKFAKARYRYAAGMCKYLQEVVLPRLTGLLQPNMHQEQMHGYLARATGLMFSVKAMNGVQHFQSIIACNRSLLEILVDMILVRYDTSGESDSKIPKWEESAKLKNCEATVTYFETRKKAPIPSPFGVRKLFTQTDGQRIRNERLQLWGIEKHPERWTGRRSLLEDIQAADKFHKVPFCDSLEEYYEVGFRVQCWNVHGSGFTGIRHLSESELAMICAVAWESCGDIALECAKLAQDDFGFTMAMADLPKEWKAIGENKALLMREALLELEKEGTK